MTTCYYATPNNFQDISGFVVTDKAQNVQAIISAKKCFFYDTCSFRFHAQLPHPESWFNYVQNQNGIVVITRCILMELASHSGTLKTEYVTYIQKMHQAGIQILVMYEETIFDILAMCFTSVERVNEFLLYAVRTVKTPTGTITDTLNANPNLKHDVLVKSNVTDSTLYTRFFQEVRNNKESEDNLGEELLAVCMHLLSHIPEYEEYKYIVLTDDKGAVGLFKKSVSNAYQHQNKYLFSVVSTPKLAQCLYERQFVQTQSEVEEILNVCTTNGEIKFLGSGEYDLEHKEKLMTVSELAGMIVRPNEIYISH